MSAVPIPPDPTPGPVSFWSQYGHVIYKILFAIAGLLAGYHGSSAVRPKPAPPPAPAATKAVAPPAEAAPPKAKHRYGWRPSAPHADDKVFQIDELPAATPPAVDLSSPPLPAPFEPPFDQGQLGSCGPNSSAKLLTYCMVKAGVKTNQVPSRLFIYYNTRALMGTVRQDSGVDNRTMLRALSQYGWCDESKWPYQVGRYTTRPPAACYAQAAARRVTDIASVQQTLPAMKNCLATGHPFVFGFTVYESFESPAADATGVIPMPGQGEGVLGGHDVLIVGYDDATQRFKFVNSWGNGWGNRGYGTIPYAYATNPGLAGDFWTVRSTPNKLAEPDDLTRLFRRWRPQVCSAVEEFLAF